MATIRVSNVEAKADAGSPTIDERVTFKRSTGENGVIIDSKQVGITSVGINTDNPQAVLDISGITSTVPTLTVTNSGGAGSGSGGTDGSIIAKFVGDSDSIIIRNNQDGDYGIYNSGQNNGIEFYDETGGVIVVYNSSERFRVNDSGVTVTGNIASDPVFITTYGAGNLDITTEQTIDLDLTLSTSGTSDFTVSATGVITVLKTGTYQVSYSISTDVTSGSARSTSRAYLRLNGSGEQTASRTYMYNRLAGSGENTSAKTIMLPLTANDTLELRAVRDSGTDTVVVLEDYTTISLVRLT